jgi:mannose-6-phosphate isomerase-like protein (cupin superfamily)
MGGTMSLPPPGHVATTRLSGDAKLAPGGSGLVLAEWTAPPGTGSVDDPPYQAPLHIHHDEDEAWYVLDGRLRVKVGDAEHEVPAGGAVIGPRGQPHTFWNPDPDASVRYLLVMGARTSALLDVIHGGERPADVEGMRALFEAYGCTLLDCHAT